MKHLLPFLPQTPTVAVIRLQGAIVASGQGLSDAKCAPLIEKAFKRGKPVAVALQINSPGGSPTQSALIAARIRRLSAEKSVPVFAFVEDIAASGGYWLACAGDEIYVDDNSITGSIGVISAGFGLQGLIERYGVERRVHTAGESKSFMDAFRPEQPEDVARLNKMLEAIHSNFIAYVKDRRGAKLSEGRDLFTGEIWVGAQAIEVGLVDHVGHLVPVMKDRFGDKVKFSVYGPKRPLLSRLGAQVVDEALGGLETRALFARYGL